VIKRTFKNVWSPELKNRRDVDIYLPWTYHDRRDRYPVVYMHDGQNLSDPATAFAGTWRSEEHTSELQSLTNLVCRLLLEKKKKSKTN